MIAGAVADAYLIATPIAAVVLLAVANPYVMHKLYAWGERHDERLRRRH
jgi:hypothetical protein